MKNGDFLLLLGILFIGLKLAGAIDWSWWAVLLPLYGPFALMFFIGLAVIVFAGAWLMVDIVRGK